jgi:hypothetical protein
VNRQLSRRELLRALAGATAGLGLGMLSSCAPPLGRANDADRRAFLPLVESSPPSPTPTTIPPAETPKPPGIHPRVVHVRNANATSWDFGNAYYGHYVNQAAVNAMVARGVTSLTGTSSPAEAWRRLVPNYAPGKSIAIKVNFNNCRSCNTDDLAIDPLIHPINAIVEGLSQAYSTFRSSDIWVYDASGQGDFAPRQIPTRFIQGCEYRGVRFFDTSCNEKAGYTSTDPSAVVTWHNPASIPTPPRVQVTDVLVDATYLINIPIVKRHRGTGVTLSLKNHFGSIEHCQPLHDWVYQAPYGKYHGGASYNPMVDVYRNTHIAGKTVLVIGDALFGNWEDNNTKARPWRVFGNAAPNSLVFATDSVAAECVMCDMLNAEQPIDSISNEPLSYASSVGLGIFERGDPRGSGYSEIDYVYVDL